ncbi:MAG TPA: chemotaxis-specific protein-glutamate methyltransferase CheB [Firmicutes bacterium]|nr:chemotaxis-specific protein-glutamate methyltransferase CheB [Bacillota bacterium]
MIRVLVVDDSAFMRGLTGLMLESDPGIRVIGNAKDGSEAVEKVISLDPDVVTMDLLMPGMNGVEAIREIMAKKPVPVVIFAAGADHSELTLEALAVGAVDFVAKPSGGPLEDCRAELIRKVRAAAVAKIRREPFKLVHVPKKAPGRLAQVVVAIGASTGGPSAIERLLAALPGDLPAGILVTQHMPPNFTTSFAKRLNRHCPLTVKEVGEEEELLEGLALIAPGCSHVVVDAMGKIRRDFSAAQYTPSIDVMMASVARAFGDRSIGIVLTGMGSDGAQGMAAIRRAGGRTIVQDEKTSVIYGMPRAVVSNGDAQQILPLDMIPLAVQRLVDELRRRNLGN